MACLEFKKSLDLWLSTILLNFWCDFSILPENQHGSWKWHVKKGKSSEPKSTFIFKFFHIRLWECIRSFHFDKTPGCDSPKRYQSFYPTSVKTDCSSCEEHERHLEKPKETDTDSKHLESLLKNRSTKDWECFFFHAPSLKRWETKKPRNWLFHGSFDDEQMGWTLLSPWERFECDGKQPCFFRFGPSGKKSYFLDVIFSLNGSQQTGRCLGVIVKPFFLLAGLSCQVYICGDFHCWERLARYSFWVWIG